MKRRAFLAATGATVVATAGCMDGLSASAQVVQTTEVRMVDHQYDPRNIEVDVGDTVTWTNEDPDIHSVAASSDNWEEFYQVEPGDEATHTFDHEGVFDAYCIYHGAPDLSGMSMKIAVGDATIENPLEEEDDQEPYG